MTTKTTKIINKTGLHARPASEFVQAAGKFDSKITIKRVSEEDAMNAKSIIILLSLGLCQGEEVEISADGPDEEEAVNKLVDLINSGFGE